MKTIEFTYTKDNGDESQRTIVEVTKPTPNIGGYDISEMSSEDYAFFAVEYNALMDMHKEALVSLLNKYDLNHSYKMFKPANMSKVISYHA